MQHVCMDMWACEELVSGLPGSPWRLLQNQWDVSLDRTLGCLHNMAHILQCQYYIANTPFKNHLRCSQGGMFARRMPSVQRLC